MSSQNFRSVAELANAVASDPDLQRQIAQDPAAALARVAASPLQTDAWVYRIVVIALGATVLAAVIGAIIITLGDALPNGAYREPPEILIALGSAAVGALAGLLAPHLPGAKLRSTSATVETGVEPRCGQPPHVRKRRI